MSSYRTYVLIRSNQTSRTRGELVRVERDSRYGNQYYVMSYHPDWGNEFFWFREHELQFVR